MKYRFQTSCTMKPYNNKRYWIDSQMVRPVVVLADNLESALSVFADIVSEKYFVSISCNALSHKNPMFRDTDSGAEQVGYVITGKTDFEGTSQYIDLWVEVMTVDYPKEFKKEKEL